MLKDIKMLPLNTFLLFFNSITEKNSISEISRRCDFTHAYVHNLVKLFTEHNLVETEKVGRVRFVRITKKGAMLKNRLNDLLYILEIVK